MTKARILQAVTEANGQRAADRIEHLKKGEMAVEAEMLLASSGWLPEPLRTPGRSLLQLAIADATTIEQEVTSGDGAAPEEDADEGKTSLPREDEAYEVSFAPHAIAAE